VFEHSSDEVGLISEYELEFQRKYDKIVETSREKIQPFYNFLSKYPYLGIEHEVGQEIAKEIKKMHLVNISDRVYYRARKPENGKIFKHDDMLNPPPEKPIAEGRFNHYGQSHLYLGETEELCAKEITNEDKVAPAPKDHAMIMGSEGWARKMYHTNMRPCVPPQLV
jgi:hypothetical protein